MVQLTENNNPLNEKMMNSIYTHRGSYTGRGSLPLFIVLALFALSSCATVMPFNNSSIIPAAEGKVKVKKDKNQNYQIKAQVSNLAPPGNLQPSRSTYVLWMDTKNNGVKNLGQMQPSNTIFSKALNAALSTTTSFVPVRFFVTAENSGAVEYPGSYRVLETDFRR